MSGLFLQIGLVAVLVMLNAAFAGSEMALVSLREGQLRRLEERGGSGKVLAQLARDPNRFLATIQIGITLAGFLASASAAVALAEPLKEPLGILGGAAEPVAIVVVTLVLAYVTLVFGELAPKRVAMQRAERWGLLAARPLALLSKLTRPAVWALARSTNIAVRMMGGDPHRQREDVTEEELRDLVAAQTSFSPEQRLIISGAFEISERTLHQVLRPRPAVLVLDETMSAAEAVEILIANGHSRAPIATGGDLDHVTGMIHLRDLIARTGTVDEVATECLFLPEQCKVLEALKRMQVSRRQMAVVIGEHGGGEGIVTVEDLIEELVGEIYDESDRDILSIEHAPDGSIMLPGGFPVHDLPDIGVYVPDGDYATVAGIVLNALGKIPTQPGDAVDLGDWSAQVLCVEQRAITRVALRRHDPAVAAPLPEDTPRTREQAPDGTSLS